MARVTNRHSIGAYSALKKLLPQDKLIDPESIRRVNAEIERLEAEGASAIAAVLSGLNMATMVCRQADLAGHVQNTLRCLEESDFPLAASHLVLVDAALGFRTRTPSVLLQSEDDPTPPASGDMVFKAALGLLGDVNFGMAAYLSPLLLSLSPYVWGFTSPRAGGVLLYTFGRRTAGHGGLATEPLQLFTPLGRETAFPVPDTTPRASSRAVEWWSR